MGQDKKVRDGRIAFILARDIGAAFVARDVELATVRALLAEALAPRAEAVGAVALRLRQRNEVPLCLGQWARSILYRLLTQQARPVHRGIFSRLRCPDGDRGSRPCAQTTAAGAGGAALAAGVIGDRIRSGGAGLSRDFAAGARPSRRCRLSDAGQRLPGILAAGGVFDAREPDIGGDAPRRREVSPSYFGSDEYSLGPDIAARLDYVRLPGGFEYGSVRTVGFRTGLGHQDSSRYIGERDYGDYEIEGLDKVDWSGRGRARRSATSSATGGGSPTCAMASSATTPGSARSAPTRSPIRSRA